MEYVNINRRKLKLTTIYSDVQSNVFDPLIMDIWDMVLIVEENYQILNTTKHEFRQF